MNKPNTQRKENPRWVCANCDNNMYYLEFNDNWHGLSVMQFVCTKCGCAPVFAQTNELHKFMELDLIKRELKKS